MTIDKDLTRLSLSYGGPRYTMGTWRPLTRHSKRGFGAMSEALDKIQTHRREYGNTLLLRRLQEILDNNQLARVLSVLENICPHCWDGDADCQCRNDE